VELFEKAGLREVRVLAIDVPTVFKDFDDYWSPFLGGQARRRLLHVALRGAPRRAPERIRSMLPIGVDGSIRLIARAWAVQGIVE